MKKLLGLVLALIFAMNVNAEEHFLVGGCTASGWNSGLWQRSQVQMVKVDGTSEWICCLKLTVGDGDNGRFKIPNSAGGWDGYWAPTQGAVLTSEWSDLSTNGSGDNKWCVAEEGIYLVTINTETLKIKAEKLTAPSKDGDFYLVGSVNDYYYAAGAITSGEQTGKIRLTANLDFTDKGFFPLASDKQKFKSEIDGAGYMIDHAVLKDEGQNIGLIRYASDGANIHDLIMGMWCYFEGNAKVGGIVGFARDGGTITIKNVINSASVKATGSTDANAAGFVGCATDGTKVLFTNCANTGKVEGQNGQCAAYLGWSQSGTTLTNCWNSGDINNMDGSAQLYRNSGAVTATNCYDVTSKGNQGTKKDEATLASGELCFLLNGGVTGGDKWYQNLGDPADATPVPFAAGGHQKVYANGAQNCDGTDKGVVTYSNTNTGFNRDPHTDADGWCSVCHQLVPDHLAPVEGYYQIGTANDLKWFANYVTGVEANVKAKLTTNIDYSNEAYKNEFIGYVGKPFKGEFDGQEHTITIAIQNREGVDRTGLFAAIDGATIKNLVVEGTATSNDQNCVGGLGGRSDGASVVENVVVKTAVSYTGSNGDATCGGFFANMESSATLKNCAFLGSIDTGSAEGNGGLVGWAGGGNNNKYINCLVAPTSYTKNGNSADFARNNPTKTNCHFVASDDARLATGELCYTLNAGGDNWYQTLTTDVTPVPFSSHSKVYANASYNCDGTPKGAVVYANVNEEHHDPHTLNGGFCDVCNAMVEYVANYMNPAADGWYEISNNKQMRWFSAMIKDYRNAHSITENANADAPVNARLMNDIDFEGVKDYMPIGGLWGQGSTRYAGTFDGQFHKIKNLVINGGNETGIFGVIATGAVVKNFTVDASCSINGGNHVGIVGEAWKSHNGEFHLICLGNEANVTGTGNNVGGILGVNMNNGGYAKCNMCQCYSTGKIVGAGENGQLSGWTGDGAYIENCYAIGEMTSCDGFARLGGNSVVKNSYCDKDLTWENHPTKIEEDWLTTGELCYKLGDKNFRQNLGEGGDAHPVLLSDHGIVNHVSAVGYATQFIPTTDVVIPADVEAYAVVVENNKISLNAIEGKISKEDAVVLKAEEGYYSFVPTTGATKAEKNDLKGAAEKLSAEKMAEANPECTKFYALSLNSENDPESVGFYWSADEGVAFEIEAGKGYLALPASQASISGFRFNNGETTGIQAMPEAADNKLQTTCFNLQGQRVKANAKGIIIMNGKKVFVK